MRKAIGMCALLLVMVASTGCIIALGTRGSYCPTCHSHSLVFDGDRVIVEVDADGVVRIDGEDLEGELLGDEAPADSDN